MSVATVTYKTGYHVDYHDLTIVRVSDCDLTLFDKDHNQTTIPFEDFESFDVKLEPT